MDNSNGNLATNFGQRKILDVISKIIADESRKVGLFLPKNISSKIFNCRETSKILVEIDIRTQKSWYMLSGKTNGIS